MKQVTSKHGSSRRKTAPERSHETEHDAEHESGHAPVLRPSEPGFVVQEAKELLGMCVAANFLGPVVFPPFPIGLVPTNDPENPLPNDDGKTYPYPEERIWPRGWTPGVPSKDPHRPWASSLLVSRLSNGAGVNSAIFCYNAKRDAYAIAFAGTLNPGAAMQDVAALLIPAGPVDLPYFKSQETYLSSFPDMPEHVPGGIAQPPLIQPPSQAPFVHLGYRDAVESLSVDPLMPNNLRSILTSIEADEIELYVTGHSLGAAVAQLFSAWVKAGGVPSKKIHVKCYSFATPKCGNFEMASNYAMALGNTNFSFNVNNSLDTAPQLPPTKETNADLINPDISSDLGSKANPVGLYASSPLAPIVKMILGQPGGPGGSSQPAASPKPAAPPIPFPFSVFLGIVGEALKAVVQPPTPSPAIPMNFAGLGVPHVLPARQPVVYNGRFYPPEFFPARDPHDLVSIPDKTTRVWWQHWPYNYAKYLSASEE